MAGAELALRLARAGSYSELEPVALGLLSSAYTMRGDEGDLVTALEFGDRALEMWVPNAQKCGSGRALSLDVRCLLLAWRLRASNGDR